MGSVSRSKSFSNSPGSSHSFFSRATNPTPRFPLYSRSLSRGTSNRTGADKYCNYLGQNYPSPSPTGLQSLPKINPNKTSHTIGGLKEGLRGAIQLAEQEIQRNSLELEGQQSQGRVYELEKTGKGLQLQYKTLEYQLSRLESLEEEYNLQQRLREGVRSMAYAYTLSDGINQKVALANVKAGFRECTETLGGLEHQLQDFLGAFHLQMKGIQGFARLCLGDVYEITVKHGGQKWKTRTKVRTKDGGQEWECPEARISAILGQDLYIKAAEIKTLGKQVLLGNKFCDIAALFSAQPQLMTVNLNPSGSLKLVLVVVWDPLAQFYAQAPAESPLRKRRLVIFPPPPGGSMGIGGRGGSRSIGSISGSSSSGDSCGIRGSKVKKIHAQMEEEEEEEGAEDIAGEVKDNLNKLASVLNDEIQGQYPELEACELNISSLRRAAFHQEYKDVVGRVRKNASNSSLNIESALEAFDFLDKCDVQSPTSPPPTTSPAAPFYGVGVQGEEGEGAAPPPQSILTTTTSFGATTDSGISSLNSRSPSPYKKKKGWVTGSEELDQVFAGALHAQLTLNSHGFQGLLANAAPE